MKKFMAVMLSVMLALGCYALVGCGNKDNNEEPAAETDAQIIAALEKAVEDTAPKKAIEKYGGLSVEMVGEGAMKFKMHSDRIVGIFEALSATSTDIQYIVDGAMLEYDVDGYGVMAWMLTDMPFLHNLLGSTAPASKQVELIKKNNGFELSYTLEYLNDPYTPASLIEIIHSFDADRKVNSTSFIVYNQQATEIRYSYGNQEFIVPQAALDCDLTTAPAIKQKFLSMVTKNYNPENLIAEKGGMTVTLDGEDLKSCVGANEFLDVKMLSSKTTYLKGSVEYTMDDNNAVGRTDYGFDNISYTYCSILMEKFFSNFYNGEVAATDSGYTVTSTDSNYTLDKEGYILTESRNATNKTFTYTYGAPSFSVPAPIQQYTATEKDLAQSAIKKMMVNFSYANIRKSGSLKIDVENAGINSLVFKDTHIEGNLYDYEADKLTTYYYYDSAFSIENDGSYQEIYFTDQVEAIFYILNELIEYNYEIQIDSTGDYIVYSFYPEDTTNFGSSAMVFRLTADKEGNLPIRELAEFSSGTPTIMKITYGESLNVTIPDEVIVMYNNSNVY